MDAIEAQKKLVQLLLTRLKACALESRSLHGVLLNLSEQDGVKAYALLENYRSSEVIQQKVESQFRDLDLLIQELAAGVPKDQLHKLLEQFDPTGKPQN